MSREAQPCERRRREPRSRCEAPCELNRQNCSRIANNFDLENRRYAAIFTPNLVSKVRSAFETHLLAHNGLLTLAAFAVCSRAFLGPLGPKTEAADCSELFGPVRAQKPRFPSRLQPSFLGPKGPKTEAAEPQASFFGPVGAKKPSLSNHKLQPSFLAPQGPKTEAARSRAFLGPLGPKKPRLPIWTAV